MPKFFVKSSQVIGNEILIDGEDGKHISKVLRHRISDIINIGDDELWEYKCEIIKIEKEDVTLNIIEKNKNNTEPKVLITLFQGMPKADKLELIVQKSVELGVFNIIPVETEFSIQKANEKTPKKIERLQKISESAAKQSGRGIIPKVHTPINFKDLLDKVNDYDLFIIAYEKETKALKSIKNGNIEKIGIVIGPEGGFSENEMEQLIKKGGISVSLGKRILRTETAGLALLSILMYEFDL